MRPHLRATRPHLGATRPRVGIAMLGLEASTWQCFINKGAFACQGIEPWQANTDAGTRRPQVRTRSPKWPINCSLPTRINIDPNLQFIKPSLPTRCVMEPYTSIQYLFSFILWRKCVWEPIVGIFHLLVGYLNLLISAMLFFIIA